MWELQQILTEITGFDAATLQPAAGAHGELCGMLMIRAALRARGQGHRTKVLIPDSAHGTNPATAAMCGFYTVSVPTDEHGNVDVGVIEREADNQTVALMLTNPNTLGLFEQRIREVTQTIHRAGGLVYGDGANLNAILGAVKPGIWGSTSCTSMCTRPSLLHTARKARDGPVVVPGTRAVPACAACESPRRRSFYLDWDRPESIGKLKAFNGHFGILARALTYILMQGSDGLREISRTAVLHANYLRTLLQRRLRPGLSANVHARVRPLWEAPKRAGVRTLDIAKRLLDFGIHPPTVYFPLIVEEAMMIEPTESESKETLDEFARVMLQIARESKSART